MQKSVDFSQLGGLYVYQNTLDFLQTAYGQVLDALGASFGNYLILTGVNVVGGVASAGWVVVNGQILPFAGGAVAAYCYIDAPVTPEQFNDGTSKNIYTTQTVRFTAVAGGSTFNFTNLQPLPFGGGSLQEVLDTVQTLINYLINIEPAVIISGCQVSAVDTGASTLAIAAGTVIINGSIVNAPSYAGAYPVYLTSAGAYTTALPGSGTFVTFDPYTSQYYLDVMFRNQHQSGDVVMNTTAATLNNFDLGTGLGKWRWLGWKLSTVLRGRVPLGYDARTVDPADGIWDANYNGVQYQGGQKTHVQSVPELAEHSHEEIVETAVNNGGSKPVGYANTEDDPHGSGIQTGTTGESAPMDWRQPFTVTIFIEKI